jgi:hypothetical protein
VRTRQHRVLGRAGRLDLGRYRPGRRRVFPPLGLLYRSGAPGGDSASQRSLPALPLLGFSDASHGWLVFGGVTWRTSDGGINWT